MKPEHGARRTIIREWMALPRERRQTPDQARAFVTKALEKHKFRCSGDPVERTMTWLMPRIGRA